MRKKILLTVPTKSQMIKRGEEQLQWSMQKGINMESWNDLQDNAWTNNTSKVGVTSHYKHSACPCVCECVWCAQREDRYDVCVRESEIYDRLLI